MGLKCPERLQGVVCHNCLEFFFLSSEVIALNIMCIEGLTCLCVGHWRNGLVEDCKLFFVMRAGVLKLLLVQQVSLMINFRNY